MTIQRRAGDTTDDLGRRTSGWRKPSRFINVVLLSFAPGELSDCRALFDASNTGIAAHRRDGDDRSLRNL